MAGNTNIIEQPVKLSDDGGDLRSQVARVHPSVSSERRLPERRAHFKHLRQMKAESK